MISKPAYGHGSFLLPVLRLAIKNSAPHYFNAAHRGRNVRLAAPAARCYDSKPAGVQAAAGEVFIEIFWKSKKFNALLYLFLLQYIL